MWGGLACGLATGSSTQLNATSVLGQGMCVIAIRNLLSSAGWPHGSTTIMLLQPRRAHSLLPLLPEPPPRARGHPPPEPLQSCAAQPQRQRRGHGLQRQRAEQRQGVASAAARAGGAGRQARPRYTHAARPSARDSGSGAPPCADPLQPPQRITQLGPGTFTALLPRTRVLHLHRFHHHQGSALPHLRALLHKHLRARKVVGRRAAARRREGAGGGGKGAHSRAGRHGKRLCPARRCAQQCNYVAGGARGTFTTRPGMGVTTLPTACSAAPLRSQRRITGRLQGSSRGQA